MLSQLEMELECEVSANPATGEVTSVKMKVGVALGGAGVVEELAGDG